MSDCMHFPDTVEEFMEQYKMTDTKQVYSNGTEYVPIFRMEQWFEHEKAQHSQEGEGTISDLISRQEARHALCKAVHNGEDVPCENQTASCLWTGTRVCDFVRAIDALPSVQPEPTRIISETRAIPSDDDRVSLSEMVTATYYDEEYEEWSQKTVTVRDVLDSVCDKYTVLPTIHPVATDINVGDKISRQVAIDAAKEAVIADEQPYVENALKSVPSVQQENGASEWVTYYKYDNFIGRYEWKRCRKCGKDMISHETDYCPNCGAKMTISK